MKTKLLIPRRGLVFLVWAILPMLPARAADRYADATWAGVDLPKVLSAAADITLKQYADCDETTVEKRMVRVYRPDGTGEAQDETFTKILTEKGKRNNRTLALSFMLPYFTVEVAKLEVIKPTGEVVPVDVAANSKETIDDSQMAMNIYDPNSRILQVNIPKVEIGDIVHSIVRTTTERSIIPGEFAEYNVLEGQGYIRHLSYEVHAPADKPLKRIVLRDEVAGTVKAATEPGEHGTLVYRWDVTNVPRMFDEPSMPPYETVLQRLLVSTTPDWQDVSKWYWTLSQPHLEATTPDMKKTVDELVAGARTDLDKVKAVFYHVSKKIRYMGLTPEKDRPGYEPHDVGLTFGKKYGVCRDKAALLVSLLRSANLKAYPVLINVGSKKDPEVPEPFFNHAIVSVELQHGEYILMDPTDENTRELLPASDRNQSYLVCRPEGETIRISPIEPPEVNLMRIKTTARLSAAGSLEAKSELSFDGINDNSYRNLFARMKPDDIRRFFEGHLKRAMPGARLKSLKLLPEDMLDVSAAIHAELEFAVDGLTASRNDKAIVNLPWIGKSLGVANFILGGTGLERRKYPLQTFVACGLKEELSLRLDDAYTGAISMPSCSPVSDECLSYQQSFNLNGQALDCARELKLKVVEFSPAQYLKLKTALETLEYDERKAPVLALAAKAAAQPAPLADPTTEPPVESNARILEVRKELDVKDARSAVYRVKYSKRILNYGGKIREAEVKLDFNPSCQEAKLVRAVVVSKSGQRQEIAKDEINLMDAGWNASAKRYTGGKILVANLPGVDIGSTIEVEFEVTTKGRAFLSGFEAFQLPDGLDKKSFRVTAPPNLKIHSLVSGPANTVKETAKTGDLGKQEFLWQSAKAEALPAEPQTPPEWLFVPAVSYFVGDVKSYYRELQAALLDRSRKATKTTELAHHLASQCQTKLDSIKAIRDFVAKAIRLAGPSFTELPLAELSPADTTLTDGYGHAADQAILLYTMLTAAGFQPEFVLASGLPPINEITRIAHSFPLPQAFQSLLVRLTLAGETYYLNDTDQYSVLGSTPYDGCLAVALATQSFETIHAAKQCGDKTEIDYKLSLTDTGKTRLQVARHYFGAGFNGKNRYFSELPPEERRRYFQETVSSVAQGARPIGELITQFDAYPGLEQFTVEMDKYAVVDGKYLYFDLPFTPSLFPVGADRRILPFFIPHRSVLTIHTEIELPPAFAQQVIAPQGEDLRAPGGGGQARITLADASGKCSLTHEFETAPAIIDPKDYPALLNLESLLGRKSSKVFLLEHPTP
jgi:transglutaminase-like putative cysteine protease